MKDVHVVTYTHKHGDDVSLYATAELAHDAMMSIVAEWRDEFDSEDTRTDQELLDDWSTFTGEREFLSCEPVTVITEIP